MSRVVQIRVKGAKAKKLGEIHTIHLGDNEPAENAVPSLLSAHPELGEHDLEVVEEESD